MQAEWALTDAAGPTNAVVTKTGVTGFRHVVVSLRAFIQGASTGTMAELAFGGTAVYTLQVPAGGQVSMTWPDGLIAPENTTVTFTVIRLDGDVSGSMAGTTIGG